MAHTHHSLDYVELGATDLATAKAFYGTAFGWQFGRRFEFTDPSGNRLGVWAER
jgi:predicted enzyme related to lactoylglutathione lyase